MIDFFSKILACFLYAVFYLAWLFQENFPVLSLIVNMALLIGAFIYAYKVYLEEKESAEKSKDSSSKGKANEQKQKTSTGKFGIVSTVNSFFDKPKKELTAGEFINVKDIRGNFLYTLDGNIVLYIKINQISTDLLSYHEKKTLTKHLTAEFSTLQKEFKFISVTRPIDINPLLSELNALLLQTDNMIQKELLRNEISVMNNYGTSGEVLERQFFIMLWEKESIEAEKDLYKRGKELVKKFFNCDISSEILCEEEIAGLCNMVNNPTNTYHQDNKFEASIPVISNTKSGGKLK